MTEPRKATDVLLGVEAEIKTLIGLVRSQDLNIKILSNKLNEVMGKMERQTTPLRPTAEAPPQTPRMPASPLQQVFQLDPERQILIDAEVKLPATDSPQGFRRTSRPETFSGDDAYLKQTKSVSQTPGQPPKNTPKFPVQMPKAPPGRVAGETVIPEFPQVPEPAIVPKSNKQIQPGKQAQQTGKQSQPLAQNAIPVMQRIVDKGGKSIFLADVEIIDVATSQPVFKTRTNGTGKWMASLGVGTYQVSINKRVSDQKDKVEAQQEIIVDGSKSPLELQTMIVR